MNVQLKPGVRWRTARRVTQFATLVAVCAAPVLGAWQRLYRGEMSAWDMSRWELPGWLASSLPGVPSRDVHAANLLMGGGGAGDFFSVAATDPVAGLVALSAGPALDTTIAWLIPIALALLLGRVFCGWFCPFGWLSRGLDRLVSIAPWQHRGFELPKARPIRWIVLGAAVIGGAWGGEWFAWVFLPHILLQQTIYSVVILGGLGAVGGALLGLLGAGLVFGPTVYCATVCPTGGALGLAGRMRRARVVVPQPDACGSCTLCHRACWLGLEPRYDAGPDCDLCTRCFTACPKAKMVVEVGRPRTNAVKVSVVAAALLLCSPSTAQEADVERKPELVLNGYRETPEFTAAVTIVNLKGVRMTRDTARQHHVELSAYVVRGSKLVGDEEGRRAPEAEVYRGPLTVAIDTAQRRRLVEFERPSSPLSTIERPIYRRRLDVQLEPGDVVTLQPVPGIVESSISWTVPDVMLADEGDVLGYFAVGLLTYGGLMLLAIGAPKEERDD